MTTSMPLLALGPLFSEGGHFAAHEVDRPCDPVKVLGPFPVSQGGKLIASIVGEPPVPDMLIGGNSNSSLRITFEPLVGDAYGRAREVVALTGMAANNRLAGEGTWDGPGRLWAYIGPPGGSAPLTTICYEQSYSASAEIVEAIGSAPARPGLAVMPGDVITTDGGGAFTLALPGNGASLWIGPNSELTLEAGQTAAETQLLGYPEWKPELVMTAERLAAAGYAMSRGYREEDIDYWFGHREATLQEAHSRVSALSDTCEAAVELKLCLESRQGAWTMINAADKGVDLAMAEFLLYAPGRAAGYLAGQFNPEGLKADYFIVGGGWYRSQNLNRLTLMNRPYADGTEPADEPVPVRLSRRGDVVRTYWSLDDGKTWNLSSRQVVDIPQTLWAGWVVKRVVRLVCQDGVMSAYYEQDGE